MNLKKLSIAAALSVGIMTIGNIASAQMAGGACPVCPPANMIPQEPICPQEVYSPMCPVPVCPDKMVMHQDPIIGCLPNCAPDAQIIKRQAYAFPCIGGSSVVFPKGNQLMQIGGGEEKIVTSNTLPSGLTAMSEYGGALTLMPKNQVGAAAPLTPVCPVQVTQGLEICHLMY